jgi:NADH:ubiquinone oxidoreductase subunit 3 (subunit A)
MLVLLLFVLVDISVVVLFVWLARPKSGDDTMPAPKSTKEKHQPL